MRPALTRRGGVVLGVALAATAAGWLFGARSLNAVAVPTAVALAVTGWLVYRAEAPTVARDPPRDGHAGETHEVGVRVEGSRTVAVTVRDALADGLDGDGTVRTVADGREDRYAVTYRERGRHTVGPARVTVADPLGLWTRTFEAGDEHALTVYPRVLPLTAPPRALAGSTGRADERGEFAGVREYRHGDPLRDVNWKASAKRPDEYVVTTYADEGTDATLTIAVEVTDGGDPDRAAVAAASLLDACLDTGAAVGLRTPAETLAPASGDSHRRRALGALAVLGHGTLPSAAREDARVAVRADATGVHVTVDDDRRSFDAMADAADAGVGA
ncbi:hypothetical protein GCM10009037_17890 [Halarchaeum grantii]|uniref:DUF58 domain-containing protein n=1 Tax=Halarchaeum grantii TaxID=1193105 RepID=A0A830FD18_9EURY|nr:DUF58 domain-containing protein [Halarchaeum grantii]GGL34709.1 hypothetical protein GCM10009037_17890 [Halarchaeum grantii]